MDETLQTNNLGYAVPGVEQRNRVLRNTYWLLACRWFPRCSAPGSACRPAS